MISRGDDIGKQRKGQKPKNKRGDIAEQQREKERRRKKAKNKALATVGGRGSGRQLWKANEASVVRIIRIDAGKECE